MLISLALAVLNSCLVIDQNEHILSEQYLRRNHICDLGCKKKIVHTITQALLLLESQCAKKNFYLEKFYLEKNHHDLD